MNFPAIRDVAFLVLIVFALAFSLVRWEGLVPYAVAFLYVLVGVLITLILLLRRRLRGMSAESAAMSEVLDKLRGVDYVE